MLSAAARNRRAPAGPPLDYEAAVRLVSRWSSDSRFVRRGRPRALSMQGAGSFATLARLAKAGSAAKASAALVDAGVIRRDAKGNLHLLRREYVPRAGGAEKMDILGRAGADFLRVLMHNLSAADGETFLQRVASYDNIGSSSLMTLRKALRREGRSALERANRLLADRDRDRNGRAAGGRRTRVSFGVYVLEEAVERRSRKR
jgi:hypothetical protein